MKIQNINSVEQGAKSVRGIPLEPDYGEKSLVFKQSLSVLSREQYDEKLGGLIRDIDAQAEKLTKRADIKEFERYRALIRDFINEVVSNGYAFQKESSFESRGRQRLFATIQTVDQKLDALAKEVLSNQADNIATVHAIDDIRGLLLDMTL